MSSLLYPLPVRRGPAAKEDNPLLLHRNSSLFTHKNEMKYLFELSSFANTSYCETTHSLTPSFFGVLSLPYKHYYYYYYYYFIFNKR
jgi:hypothetical protein